MKGTKSTDRYPLSSELAHASDTKSSADEYEAPRRLSSERVHSSDDESSGEESSEEREGGATKGGSELEEESISGNRALVRGEATLSNPEFEPEVAKNTGDDGVFQVAQVNTKHYENSNHQKVTSALETFRLKRLEAEKRREAEELHEDERPSSTCVPREKSHGSKAALKETNGSLLKKSGDMASIIHDSAASSKIDKGDQRSGTLASMAEDKTKSNNSAIVVLEKDTSEESGSDDSDDDTPASPRRRPSQHQQGQAPRPQVPRPHQQVSALYHPFSVPREHFPAISLRPQITAKEMQYQNRLHQRSISPMPTRAYTCLQTQPPPPSYHQLNLAENSFEPNNRVVAPPNRTLSAQEQEDEDINRELKEAMEQEEQAGTLGRRYGNQMQEDTRVILELTRGIEAASDQRRRPLTKAQELLLDYQCGDNNVDLSYTPATGTMATRINADQESSRDEATALISQVSTGGLSTSVESWKTWNASGYGMKQGLTAIEVGRVPRMWQEMMDSPLREHGVASAQIPSQEINETAVADKKQAVGKVAGGTKRKHDGDTDANANANTNSKTTSTSSNPKKLCTSTSTTSSLTPTPAPINRKSSTPTPQTATQIRLLAARKRLLAAEQLLAERQLQEKEMREERELEETEEKIKMVEAKTRETEERIKEMIRKQGGL